jgi:hypothetical protein
VNFVFFCPPLAPSAKKSQNIQSCSGGDPLQDAVNRVSISAPVPEIWGFEGAPPPRQPSETDKKKLFCLSTSGVQTGTSRWVSDPWVFFRAHSGLGGTVLGLGAAPQKKSEVTIREFSVFLNFFSYKLAPRCPRALCILGRYLGKKLRFNFLLGGCKKKIFLG